MKTGQLNVVLVDDHVEAAESIALLLGGYGCHVWTCTTGTDALRLAEEKRPHCVIFDISMPGIPGDEVCTRLRERHGDDLVLVAVTGLPKEDPRVARILPLVNQYFQKPADVEAMWKLLQHASRPHAG